MARPAFRPPFENHEVESLARESKLSRASIKIELDSQRKYVVAVSLSVGLGLPSKDRPREWTALGSMDTDRGLIRVECSSESKTEAFAGIFRSLFRIYSERQGSVSP